VERLRVERRRVLNLFTLEKQRSHDVQISRIRIVIWVLGLMFYMQSHLHVVHEMSVGYSTHLTDDECIQRFGRKRPAGS
jgi:hypothetical protein